MRIRPGIYNNRHLERSDGGKTRFGVGAAGRYSVLKQDALCAMPVQGICDPQGCMLFLWATWPCLPEAMHVMQAWGFRYITLAFLWVKVNRNNGEPFFGIGYYTKSNSEPCLLGVRGDPVKLSNSVSQILLAPEMVVHPRLEHSEKPALARERIVQLCGDVPRVELFSRHRVEGWYMVGNEIDGRDIRDVLPEMTRSIRLDAALGGLLDA